MRFSWDPAKSQRNIAECGLDFASAAAMWDSPMAVWVQRGDDLLHIFSFRKANGRETQRYQAHISDAGLDAADAGQGATAGPDRLGTR